MSEKSAIPMATTPTACCGDDCCGGVKSASPTTTVLEPRPYTSPSFPTQAGENSTHHHARVPIKTHVDADVLRRLRMLACRLDVKALLCPVQEPPDKRHERKRHRGQDADRSPEGRQPIDLRRLAGLVPEA